MLAMHVFAQILSCYPDDMSTESMDPRFASLDLWPLDEAVRAIWDGQLAAVASLEVATGIVAEAATAAAERLHRSEGRLVYVGAGTSGRVAAQDGIELVPTFDWPEERLLYLIAGGEKALLRAVEGAEDDEQAARDAVRDNVIGPSDVMIAIAASGSTPFTCAALEAARAQGVLGIAIANNQGGRLLENADFAILADTGAEVLAGSTRMKAGTAQKAAVTMLSTAIMLALGRVYHGRMVAMRATNEKLRRRAVEMVAALTADDAELAKNALEKAGYDVRIAVLVANGMSADEARNNLDRHRGQLGPALAELGQGER